jgi:hypothetical protein
MPKKIHSLICNILTMLLNLESGYSLKKIPHSNLIQPQKLMHPRRNRWKLHILNWLFEISYIMERCWRSYLHLSSRLYGTASIIESSAIFTCHSPEKEFYYYLNEHVLPTGKSKSCDRSFFGLKSHFDIWNVVNIKAARKFRKCGHKGRDF